MVYYESNMFLISVNTLSTLVFLLCSAIYQKLTSCDQVSTRGALWPELWKSSSPTLSEMHIHLKKTEAIIICKVPSINQN